MADKESSHHVTRANTSYPCVATVATVTVVHTALGSRKKHGSSRAPSLLLSLTSRALNRFTSELRVDQESGTSKLRFLSFQVSFPMIAGVEAALCASDTKTSGALVLFLFYEINMANSGTGSRPDSFSYDTFLSYVVHIRSGHATLADHFRSIPAELHANM
jgi:hypothetical protein